ncbi:polyphenol oxidase family protein [Mycobacterium lepromatosis]|uniref:polyphenol oxidase family protein n=1 Tax=Mycobacterium lepromatosis TaxID=480418 RepID=UPI0005F76A10|nr:polyphenol oxidase family protein [Mycobacterium lepromatosis]
MSVRIRRVSAMRAGGVSPSLFDSLNLGDYVGDDPTAVATHRARLVAATGLGVDRVVWMSQVYGDRVKMVHEPCDTAVDDTDALVTRIFQLVLAVFTVHYMPVLLADAHAGVTAAVDVGWLGVRQGVVARAVDIMMALGAHVGDIAVLLGLAVSGRNYEVPAAMADEVEVVLSDNCTTTSAGTSGLDLRVGIACQLCDLGVMPIEAYPRCTVAGQTLFSHRQTASTGRLVSLVCME